jgi:hypothetical protein
MLHVFKHPKYYEEIQEAGQARSKRIKSFSGEEGH